MTIYVVTSGEYSDYGIRAMFSTKEKAESYVTQYTVANRYENPIKIEEWELDAEAEKIAGSVYAVVIDKRSGDMIHKYSDTEMVSPWSRNCEVTYGNGTICVKSPISFDHALKVAAEHRQEMLRAQA